MHGKYNLRHVLPALFWGPVHRTLVHFERGACDRDQCHYDYIGDSSWNYASCWRGWWLNATNSVLLNSRRLEAVSWASDAPLGLEKEIHESDRNSFRSVIISIVDSSRGNVSKGLWSLSGADQQAGRHNNLQKSTLSKSVCRTSRLCKKFDTRDAVSWSPSPMFELRMLSCVCHCVVRSNDDIERTARSRHASAGYLATTQGGGRMACTDRGGSHAPRPSNPRTTVGVTILILLGTRSKANNTSKFNFFVHDKFNCQCQGILSIDYLSLQWHLNTNL